MLVTLNEILKYENKYKKAVGAFNTPNLEAVLAVIKTAEQLNCPAIISHAQIHEPVISIEDIGVVMVEMAKRSKAQIAVHLDHGEDFEYCKKAIDMGFSSVMIDGSTLSYEENIALTKKVCEYAHSKGVSVEGELGRLKGREGGENSGSDLGEYTDPNKVQDFIDKTGVDALAIAFGTAHGIYDKPPVLNFDIIDQVAKLTDVPLVMHGGSGIDEVGYKTAINKGISKINYYTYMAYDAFDAVKQYTNQNQKGFYHELSSVATKSQAKKVKEVLTIFNQL